MCIIYKPFAVQVDLVKFCQQNQIHVMAYCPLASSEFGLLSDPTLVAIAENHGDVEVSSVVLQWFRQRGITPVPKSTNFDRLIANLSPAKFTLSDDEVGAITALGRDPRRVCPNPADIL